MAQLTLFDSTDIVLVDHERGRVSYTARFVDVAIAGRWFAELRTAVRWRSERRLMYEREVDVPRLMASFRLDEPERAVPEPIQDALRVVTERLDVAFNSVGLNLYR